MTDFLVNHPDAIRPALDQMRPGDVLLLGARADGAGTMNAADAGSLAIAGAAASAWYGDADLRDYKFEAPGIVIRTAQAPGEFRTVIRNWKLGDGFTLEDLVVVGYANAAGHQPSIELLGSKRARFNRLSFEGGGATVEGVQYSAGYGLVTQAATDWVATACRWVGWRRGVYTNGGGGGEVRDCEIRDFSEDGITIGGPVEGFVLRDSRIVHPALRTWPEGHADYLAAQNVGSARGVRGLKVIGNHFSQLDPDTGAPGGWAQVIFVRNNGGGGFEDVEASDNTIWADDVKGIYCEGVDGLAIARNHLIPATWGQMRVPQISTPGCRNILLTDNDNMMPTPPEEVPPTRYLELSVVDDESGQVQRWGGDMTLLDG